MHLSESPPHGKKFTDVKGKRIAYVEAGQGDAIVLLHGNPTSSYWPRAIPIGENANDIGPPDVAKIVRDYGHWLAADASMPKLFINAEPGSILVGRQREFCRSWPNQKEVTVRGLHFIQEDSPLEIGKAVSDWLRSIGRSRR